MILWYHAVAKRSEMSNMQVKCHDCNWSKVIKAGKSINLCFIKDFIIKFKSKNKYFVGHFIMTI